MFPMVSYLYAPGAKKFARTGQYATTRTIFLGPILPGGFPMKWWLHVGGAVLPQGPMTVRNRRDVSIYRRMLDNSV